MERRRNRHEIVEMPLDLHSRMTGWTIVQALLLVHQCSSKTAHPCAPGVRGLTGSNQGHK